eukprot:6186621-Pleurochrysis_carterae.AAC.2
MLVREPWRPVRGIGVCTCVGVHACTYERPYACARRMRARVRVRACGCVAAVAPPRASCRARLQPERGRTLWSNASAPRREATKTLSSSQRPMKRCLREERAAEERSEWGPLHAQAAEREAPQSRQMLVSSPEKTSAVQRSCFVLGCACVTCACVCVRVHLYVLLCVLVRASAYARACVRVRACGRMRAGVGARRATAVARLQVARLHLGKVVVVNVEVPGHRILLHLGHRAWRPCLEVLEDGLERILRGGEKARIRIRVRIRARVSVSVKSVIEPMRRSGG